MKKHTFIAHKKHIAALLLLALFSIATLPQSASALSCLNPEEMIKMYVDDDQYTVALVEAGTIKTKGSTHDQFITTKTLYKGELGTTDTVSFTFDETWAYLCTNAPANAGDQAVYVLKERQVAQVFTVDSQNAQTLLDSIKTPEVASTPVDAAEVEKKTLMGKIVSLLKQLISLLAPDSIVLPEVTEAPADYIGMSTLEAAVLADKNDVPFRVVEIDGEPQITTKDFREGRINAVVENDVVVSYTVEGNESDKESLPNTGAGTHDEIIGMTTANAQAYAKQKEVDFRTGTIDGEPMPVTMDYRVGRITASVTDGIVVDYSVE